MEELMVCLLHINLLICNTTLSPYLTCHFLTPLYRVDEEEASGYVTYTDERIRYLPKNAGTLPTKA